MSPRRPRRHLDLIREAVPLAGRVVLDAGCGGGALTAWLARAGARAIGLDPKRVALEATAGRLGRAASLVAGDGELLPLATGSVDAIIWLNALHHVPDPARALAECERVLAPGGDLVVIEPLAEGSYFELVRLVDDEIVVRALAARAFAALRAIDTEPVASIEYDVEIDVASLDGLIADIVPVDPTRRAAVAAARSRLEAAWERCGEVTPEGGRLLLQPCRFEHRRRTGAAPVHIAEAAGAAQLRACLAIRRTVFVAEQGVPLALEIDAHDATCAHLLATVGGQPVGTLRWRPYRDGAVKIERVAVLRPWRGRRIGRALMTRLLDDLDAARVAASVLDAQLEAIAFYERLGYVATGQTFMDAGIAHRHMRRPRPL